MSRDVHDWVIIDDIAVSITRPGESLDSTWREFAKDIEKNRVTRVLGGATGNVSMTSVQRKIISEVLSAQKVRVVGVTDDRLVRGVITAVSWLGVDIKSFPWSQIHDAMSYLQIPESKTGLVTEALTRLKNKPITKK